MDSDKNNNYKINNQSFKRNFDDQNKSTFERSLLNINWFFTKI